MESLFTIKFGSIIEERHRANSSITSPPELDHPIQEQVRFLLQDIETALKILGFFPQNIVYSNILSEMEGVIMISNQVVEMIRVMQSHIRIIAINSIQCLLNVIILQQEFQMDYNLMNSSGEKVTGNHISLLPPVYSLGS